MKTKLIDDHSGRRTFAVVFDIDQDVMSGLLAFATDYQLTGSHFTGIGGFRDVVLGYYDWDAKAIRRNPIREQVEVASLIGTIALGMDGKPVVHGHVVLGKSDGSALAGHLFEGHVRPTLEIVVEEVPEHLQRHRVCRLHDGEAPVHHNAGDVARRVGFGQRRRHVQEFRRALGNAPQLIVESLELRGASAEVTRTLPPSSGPLHRTLSARRRDWVTCAMI